MSGSFEKETTASTAKSLVGALVALGSGFIFMFLGLVAVTASSAKAEGDRSARILVQTLEADLLAYQASSATVSKDQTVLKFRCLGKGGAVEELTYKVIGESGEVSRVVGDEGQKVAKVTKLRFEISGGLLRLHWITDGVDNKTCWALNRWQASKGKS